MADVPVRWTHLSTWPWIFYVWLVFLAAGWIRPAWRWFHRRKVQGWPTVQGSIELAKITSEKKQLNNSVAYRAELRYSYSVESRLYGGRLRRSFSTEAEAADFIRELEGKHVTVSFNPHKPGSSDLSETSLQTLLQSRTPVREEDIGTGVNELSEWVRPLLWPVTVLSAVGLILSVWVHINALEGHKPSSWFWGLHVGVFVVFFPAVLVAQRRVGNVNRRDFWKVVLRGAPEWMRYLLYAAFGYAFLNWALTFTRGVPSGMEDWRGFSATWIVFYSASLAILYSATIAGSRLPRCLNGHVAMANASFCPRCGQPVLRHP